MNKRRIYVWSAIVVGIVAGWGCAPMREGTSYPAKEGLIGKSGQQILACAGTPLSKETEGNVTVLTYYKECGQLERSFPGTKASVPGIRHGCGARVVLKGDRVTNIDYQPSPRGGIEHCEEIFQSCTP